jgi:diguanylate cyclase (GGDEF)-like protein
MNCNEGTNGTLAKCERTAADLTPAQFLSVIATQTEIAKLGLHLDGVMALVAERAQPITGASGAVVEMADGEDMVYEAAAGVAAGLLDLRLKRKNSLSCLCVELAATLQCDDSESDPRVDREACRRVGLRSMVVVPLIHHGRAIGALKVVSPRQAAFGESDVRLLSLMSELIAASMYHAATYGADELFRQATTDQLTGLANRALFFDRLRQGIVHAKREGARLGVVMIDMDGLKPINDRYGHRAGDAAIAEIGRRIAEGARKSDTVARLGGDEFAVLLLTVDSREGTLLAARRIAERCNRPFDFEGRRLPIGASLGIAIYPDDTEQPERLAEIADQAMYTAKRAKNLMRPSSPTL